MGFIAGLLLPRFVTAEWKHARYVAQGTAQVLDKGEINFGAFAPIAYGLTDRLTIQTHPVFDLLLLVNAAGRWRLYQDRNWVFSASFGYKQGFLSNNTEHVVGEHVGEGHLGMVGSLILHDRAVLTTGLYLAPNFVRGATTDEPNQLQHGLGLHVAAHLLASKRDLLTASAYVRHDVAAGSMDTPVVTVAYVRDVEMFEPLHVVIGLTSGNFSVRRVIGDQGAKLSTEIRRWPILPVIDVWWRM
jgi:hypothetical protein